MAMMAITTNSSIKVNPRRLRNRLEIVMTPSLENEKKNDTSLKRKEAAQGHHPTRRPGPSPKAAEA
jgi:hypothetical protein